jgi:transcriptional antiterminator RfaH
MVICLNPLDLGLTQDLSDADLLFGEQEFDFAAERKWWIFYTKSRQEKALANYLRTRRIPHYLPLYKKQIISRGRRLTSIVPLFSNYLFQFGDQAERITALESNRIARTIDVSPARQDELWNDLTRLERLIRSNVPLTIESQIRAGERVRIKSGRLAGLEGTVVSRRGGSRLLVTVNYLQQGASIEIEDFALETI